MKTPTHPEQIEARLKIVRGRIRGVQRARGMMVVATVALGGLLVLMAVDFLFSPLPTGIRVALTAAWAVAVLAAVKHGFGPLLKPIGLLQVARWLEGRHPEMEERLSTVLELGHQGDGISAGLLESLGRAAEADIATVDPGVEVRSARTTRRWARPAMVLLALLAMAFAVWPREASRLLVRAVAPFSETGNAAAGKFKVTPGDIEVLADAAVKIDVGYTGSAKTLELWMEMENGKRISQELAKTDAGFRYVMDPVRAGFRYRVRAGREESDGFTVTVWPVPELLEARTRLEFPSYTGEPPQETAADRGLEAVVGTRVTVTGRLNTAVESAWLELDGQKLADGEIERAAGGGRVSLSWLLAAGGSGQAVVKIKHRLGREIVALEFPVVVVDDQPPVVVLLSPVQRDFKVRPDEVLPLKYEVTEDFTVAKVAVEVDAGGSARASLDQTLPPRVANSKPPRFVGEAPVSIGSLVGGFPGVSTLRLRLRADDSRPADAGGPGIGYSEWVTLRIDQGAESLARQELREQHEGAKRTIEEAMRATREGRERMEWHRGEIRKPELSENARKNLQESAEKLAAAEAKLAELAKQMKESVHAQKADEVTKAAEMVAKAREELENSQLQDDPAQREAKLDSAREDARESEKQLEQVRNAMDQDRQKIEDLARLMELAQRQQELARQAEANVAKQDPAEKLPEPWKNEQRQVEEQIKHQLRERPEGKAEALKKQTEQATALAQDAREAAKAQQALAEQAKQVSPESLKQALANEQAEIAKEANAAMAEAQEARNGLADTLPEAANAAEKATAEIRKGDLQAATDSAKSAAKAMDQAAEKAAAEKPQEGNVAEAAAAEALGQLAERQEQLAGALEQLAKGDAAAAVKAMAGSQAERSAELAETIEHMPQLDGNGAVQDAKNSSNQGQRKAAEAAAKGTAGDLTGAEKPHGESGQNFEKAAQSLDQAAKEFNQAAQELASHSPNPQRAEVSPEALAEAFQQASQAASSPQAAGAASQAAAAAKSLAQAAESGRQQMQGKGPSSGAPSPPGGPPDGNPPGSNPGENPDNRLQVAEADPGVPPELAKLGISSDDWAKIQASLKSDVGAGEGDAVPEEYRGLVKGYFESMSKKAAKE